MGYSFGFRKPTIITSTDELAKIFPAKESQDFIGKQVNFANEQLLLFAWEGGVLDRLSFKVEQDKDKPVVIFSYFKSPDKGLGLHAYLYAVPKKVRWLVM